MMKALLVLELALRGAAAGMLAVTGLAFFREGAGRSVRISGGLFSFAVAAYALISSPVLGQALGVLQWPALVAALGGVGYCWLFVTTLFEDRPISWRSLAPAAALTLIGLFGVVMPPHSADYVWVLHNLLEIALSLHALAVIHRGWRGDLVETRRRLRGPFMALVAGYAIAVAGVEIGQRLGIEANWYSFASAATLTILSLAGGAVFLSTRATVLGIADPEGAGRPAAHEPDAADRLALELLEDAMQKREVWRQEGLTIGALAREVRVPEHALRRLINGHLGHRNFSAYINARRIAAAKQVLADPSHARTSVATVAFDLGFGSLGPFNRSFKEATDQTPTQWRSEALEKNPSNP